MTRANVEAAIVDRAAGMLAAVGKDSTTVDGTNASLNYPIGKAVGALGYVVDDPAAVSDADVGRVPAAKGTRFLGLVELYTLESVLGNWTGVDEKYGQDEQKLSQLRTALEKRIAVLEGRVGVVYGNGGGRALTAPMGPTCVPNDPNNRTPGRWSIP